MQPSMRPCCRTDAGHPTNRQEGRTKQPPSHALTRAPCLVHHRQDLTLLLKSALGIQDACIFNPGLVHLSESEGTMLMSLRTYWGQHKGTPCIRAKVRPVGTASTWANPEPSKAKVRLGVA